MCIRPNRSCGKICVLIYAFLQYYMVHLFEIPEQQCLIFTDSIGLVITGGGGVVGDLD